MDHKIIMYCCMIVSVLYCIVVLLDSPPSGTVANIKNITNKLNYFRSVFELENKTS